MEQYLIDTSIVSDYLSASFSSGGMVFMDSVIDAVPNISVITQIELLCWTTEEATEKQVRQFIADSIVFDIKPAVITQCVSVRRNKKNQKPRCNYSCYCIGLRLHYRHQK